MSQGMKNARNAAIVAVLALLLFALPGGGATLRVVFALLGILFFTAIGLLAYRLYRERRFTLDSLPDQDRLILYCSIGLIALTFAGRQRLSDIGGAGGLVFVVLLGIAGFGLYWVYSRSRRYG
ncbi:MAG: hypothetical protein NVSMB25_09210 [Thermoleophilaceae bacterium]